MNAVSKIGYDGHPLYIEQVRDPDGQGKRELTRERRYDTIGKLRKTNAIDEVQWDAACRLQQQAEAAELRSGMNWDGVRTARGRFSLSDAKDSAMAAHADTRASVELAMGRAGTLGSRLLQLVVIDNLTLQQAARIMGEDHRRLSMALRVALDVLVRHYRLG